MTETGDVTADDLGSSTPGQKQGALVTLAFQPERPLDPPLRWSLKGLDSVWFSRGKGAARAETAKKGSEPQLRVEVPDKFISSDHASLQKIFGRWVLADEGSKNGTFVDGERVDKLDLKDGTVFEIGHTFFVFRQGGEGAADGSMHPEYGARLEALKRAAPAKLPIVLRGETGTGKEVLARRVHQLSGRTGAFQPINCAALAPTLVESELFGYRKGAFSGATEERPGLIRSADQGTLFLDEIGDLPLPAQGALLRVLQESEVTPVGGTKAVPVDFRLVVATHRDLEQMAASGAFRHDLLARITGFTLTLPPLRDRREDLGLLISALLQRHAPGRQFRFSQAAARALFRYAWPLNVRELEKALALAAAIAPDEMVDLEQLPESLRAAPSKPAAPALDQDEARHRDELVSLLKEHKGNVTAVARVLGKARVQVQRWMKRYHLRPTVFR